MTDDKVSALARENPLDDIVRVRDIAVVTAEIRMIEDQARQVVHQVLCEAAIKIGIRLEEAKQLVPQGQWLEYLDKELGYKPSTAQNYMKIAREFGNDQIGLDGKTAAEIYANLGYTKLALLAGVPDDDRRELAEGNDLESMSSREVADLIRERDAAKKAADDAKMQLEEQQKVYDVDLADARGDAEKAKAEAADLKTKLAKEKEKAKAAQDARAAAEKARDQLAEQAQAAEAAPPPETSPEELERLREELRQENADAIREAEGRAEEFRRKYEQAKNPAVTQVNFLFGELQQLFPRLQASLDALDGSQPETGPKMRGAIFKWVAQMNEVIGSVQQGM